MPQTGEILGENELFDQLRAIGEIAAPKVMLGALRAGMEPVLDQARANAPVGSKAHYTYKGNPVFPGFLRDSVAMVVGRSKLDGKLRAVVGVKKEAFYGVTFLEEGTKWIEARRWLTPALESRTLAVVADMRDYLRGRLTREIKKKRRNSISARVRRIFR